jgi:hypothetical protein
VIKKKEKGSKKTETKKAPKKVESYKSAPKNSMLKKKELKKTAQPMGAKAATKTMPAKKTEQPKRKTVQTIAQKNPATQSMATDSGKKRLMISYEKLPHEVIEVIRSKYPYGYNHDLKEVKGIDNKKFFVLPIDLPEVVYLVKVDLRKPIKIQDAEDEEDIFTPAEEFTSEEENFPAEDLEQMEGEEEPEEQPKKRKKDDEDEDE